MQLERNFGIGCMRWRANVEENRKIVRFAMNNNINYFETAPEYTKGINEIILADALKGLSRNQYRIATKLHVHLCSTYEDCEKSFKNSLMRFNTDYIDYYLLHMLNKELFLRAVNRGMLDFCDKMKKIGKIRFLGFSFHDNYEAFKWIINSYPWNCAQVRMNYLDDASEATLEGIKLAENLNIPISVMQPLKGGILADLPKEMRNALQYSKVNQDPIRLALKWLSNLTQVKLILLGAATEQQLSECCKHTDVLRNSKLTTDEIEIIAKIKSIYVSQKKVNCTYCMYCNNVCPSNIPIGHIFMQYNASGNEYNFNKKMISMFSKFSCFNCGKCESICPQAVPVRLHLTNLKKSFNTGGEG